MTEPLKISNSRIRTWRRCFAAHDYKYNQRLRRRKKALPLLRGVILHDLISAWVEGRDWEEVFEGHLKEFHKLFAEEKEEYGNLPEEIPLVMDSYIHRWENDGLVYLTHEGKSTEHYFEVEIMPGILLIGYIDGVVRDPEGRVWIVEHKSGKRIPREEVRFTDLQTTIYGHILPQIGFPEADGVLWDYIRTKPPTVPRQLKNGTLSKAKNIDTDYDTYYDTILEHGLNPDDYQDMLQMLEEKGDTFYRRIYLPISSTLTKSLMSDLKETALMILHLGDKLKARNITRECSFCEFQLLCQAELRGLDAEFIRKTEYEVRERREKDDDREETEEED